MQVICVFAGLLAAAFAAPQPQNPDAEATVVRYDSENIGVDGYKYSVETSNGINLEEEGQLENAGSEDESIAVHGSFSYVGPDGVTYTVNYIADKNGFQPQGEHIPQTPQIAVDSSVPQTQARSGGIAAAPLQAQGRPAGTAAALQAQTRSAPTAAAPSAQPTGRAAPEE